MSSLDAVRRRRAAQQWLYKRKRSDDPAVAEEVIDSYRRLEQARGPWDSRVFRVANWVMVVVFVPFTVHDLVFGASGGWLDLLNHAFLALVGICSLFVFPGWFSRRTERAALGAAEARDLLAAQPGGDVR